MDVNGDHKVTVVDSDIVSTNLRSGAVPPYFESVNQFRPVSIGLKVE